MDGALDEPAWDGAPRFYLARVGDLSPFNPVVGRMLWDDEHLYVGFEGVDYDLRATFTERDSIVSSKDDCFEVFLVPPSGGELELIELQINPRGAFLDIGYAEGRAFEEARAWDWSGARWAVRLDGTLNDDQRDRGWSAELALPWAALEEAGIDRPEVGDTWTGLLTCINRTRLPGGRTGRELTSWPVLGHERFNRVHEYGELRFVGADPAELPIEGFVELVHGSDGDHNALRPDDRGMAPWWLLDEQTHSVSWRTRAVPADAEGPVTFMFRTHTIGRREASSQSMTLHLNNRRLIDFEPHRFASETWREGEVSLAYHHRGGERYSSGVVELTVPAGYVPTGEPATLRVEPTSEVTDYRFSIRAWLDAARFWYYEQRWE